jgi:hypothetical protein
MRKIFSNSAYRVHVVNCPFKHKVAGALISFETHQIVGLSPEPSWYKGSSPGLSRLGKDCSRILKGDFMTFLRRICLLALIFSFGLAGTANAQNTYSLGAGSGAQLHIGNGLALPIQSAATVTGGDFPPLGIPVVGGATVMQTAGGQLTVPPAVLSKSASQTTVGVFFSNPTLYAVGTNIGYRWPVAQATFNSNGNPALNIPYVTRRAGSTITFRERVVGKRFGGAGGFGLSHAGNVTGQPGILTKSPVTIWAIAGGANPPCTHTSITPATMGGDPTCRSLLIAALPGSTFAAGAGTDPNNPFLVTTPGGTAATGGPNPGIAWAKFGPIGTVSSAAFSTANNPSPLRNTATSDGFQLTTAKITISASQAAGTPEVFVISGDDTRTVGGQGTIQMVAGGLSDRNLSGPNTNRAWVRLNLNTLSSVPTMSPLAQGIVVLLLLAVPAVYFGTRNRRSEAV